MLSVNNLSIMFNGKALFSNVNLKFEGDNCYGIIGANGAGKTTFLRILNKEIESTTGEVVIGKGERISVLCQDHNKYNDWSVLDTVISGDEELYNIKTEKEQLYTKENFTDADGIRIGILEDLFLKKNGWQAEADAAILLNGLGIDISLHNRFMKELKESDKVKVLLARALFGNPDILLLDEPTNGLDIESKQWLEEFLINFKNTVIVISHDRYFLNKVCTYMVDIDYGKMTMFVGNYDFWYSSSQLIQQQMKDSNKKKETKIAELQDFIRRFSANASKSKQATSRKKLLEKIVLEDIKPSNRQYPYINFEPERYLGKQIIELNKVTCQGFYKNVRLIINPNDKIALVGDQELAKTAFLKMIFDGKCDSGNISYGSTVKMSYFPNEYQEYFDNDLNMFEWLQQFSQNKEEKYVRGFLGKMLFTGEESLKKVKVLSGGEKVRLMLSKMMLEQANVLIFDNPTSHLDMESITSLNEGLKRFKGVVIFTSHDQQLINTVANRIIEIKTDESIVDRITTYEEYLKKSSS